MPNSIHRKVYCHGVPSLSTASERISAVIDGGGHDPDPGSERSPFPSLSIEPSPLFLAEQVDDLYAAGRPSTAENRRRRL
jgi:hypothetical protein